MSIIAKGSDGDFEPCPAGMYQGVCVDVIDKGMVPSTYNGEEKIQHKVQVRWQVDEPMDDGKPYLVTKQYTLSLHEKANLRADLESWRGRAFSAEELQGFDLEKLLGANGQLNIVHNEGRDGRTWANIAAITPLSRGMAKIAMHDYVRVADRSDSDQSNDLSPVTPGVEPPTAEDIPF
jgi:hypothetical protein